MVPCERLDTDATYIALRFQQRKNRKLESNSLMNKTLKKIVLKELCPDGTWRLTDVMKSALKLQLSRLPRGEVSEDERRYPTTPVGMRAFLVRFFTRHILQTQNSLLDYMISEDFLEIVRHGNLRILDIGSGPAVASLAISDMLRHIFRYIGEKESRPIDRRLHMDYVLNDTSGICLGTGQRMLADYFRILGKQAKPMVRGRTISIQKAFPDNMHQIRRIMLNLGFYDIIILSYVVSPLDEHAGLTGLFAGLRDLETLCSRRGRIVILQDKYETTLMGQIGRALGEPSRRKESRQEIFPIRNIKDTYTYWYYCCLYSPMTKAIARQSRSV